MGPDRPLKLTRRAWLGAGLAAAGAAASASWRRWAWLFEEAAAPIAGTIVGPSARIGHLLRSGNAFPPPTRTLKTSVAIVGGGISGLSAGWKLLKSGIKDFVVLDLEEDFGGNSRWGANEVTAYPWGAHYIPFPTPESKAVHELLRELGVETGRDAKGRPVYDERYVCFAPQERLFLHGRWQEGLFPRIGATSEDLRQYKEFKAEMNRYRRIRDAEGRPAFAIPMELSSRRGDLLALDRISMAEYLKRKGWASPRLRWFVEYACRDDYGCTLENTSAWAGAHYFAARGEGEQDQVLTWPEGNGWVVRKLAERLQGRLVPNALAFNVEQTSDGVRVDYLHTQSGAAVRVLCKQAIVCLPQFVARKVVASLRGKGPDAFSYAPWMVANLTVEDPPAGRGAPPSWDNVLYDSESLGYVSATHQALSRETKRSVWTYYLPLTAGDPAENRRKALAAPWSDWKDRVLKDLWKAHPDIAKHVRRLDVMLWGHGMVRPTPGFLWGGAREAASESIGDIHFGHSDLSGLSLFEEAQYRGIKAAEAVIQDHHI